MSMKRWMFLIVAVMFVAGCSSMSPLDKALEMSGANRGQWEQVLRHYSIDRGDSLKYRAACFLIANMPGHGWFEGRALDAYYHWVDSVYGKEDFVFNKVLKEAFFQQADALSDLDRKEDILCLDSTFLITHIDSTFSAIAKRPWLQTLSFEQLCEYVLPYRVGHETPCHLFHLQDSLFENSVAKWLDYDDLCRDANEIFRRCRVNKPYGVMVELPYRDKWVQYELLGCVPMAFLAAWWGKLLMCPVATDMNPAMPDRNGQHCWSVMIDNRQANQLILLAEMANGKGKVYRHAFSRQVHREQPVDEFTPPFFRECFYEDVTSFYTSVEDVVIKPDVQLESSVAYLCVFNNLKWQPVAQATLSGGQFHFKDVGRGVVYLPVVYHGDEQLPIASPFLLESGGDIRWLLPDTVSNLTLELTRKYPSKYENASINEPFSHTVLEASNVADFSEKDSIGVFDRVSLQQWADASMNCRKAYRYWRMRSASFFVFGECFLYDGKGQRLFPLLEGKADSVDVAPAFDDDPLSYARSDMGGCFTLDFGREVMVSRAACMLRNDGNNVWEGHWYELFYHDGKDWRSLGVQVAKGRSLVYGNVPGGALLWLRDLTTGMEERIFTYDNGRIYYW